MANARVARGRDSERIVADWFRAHGWPKAQRRPASLPGSDVMGVPFNAEVKARRWLTQESKEKGSGASRLNLLAWLKQAGQRAGLSFLVTRPDGYGEARIAEWPVVMRLDDFTALLVRAGLHEHVGTCDSDEWEAIWNRCFPGGLAA